MDYTQDQMVDCIPGPGGGLYTWPGGGLYTWPGGGLYTWPGGGAYSGADTEPYMSNIPPWHIFVQELEKRRYYKQAELIRRYHNINN